MPGALDLEGIEEVAVRPGGRAVTVVYVAQRIGSDEMLTALREAGEEALEKGLD